MKTPFLLTVGLVLAAGVAMAAPRGAKLDADGDRAISRAEAAAQPRLAGHFDRLDSNRDGRLTADERPGKRHRGRRDGIQRLIAMDANRDGRIARTEADGRLLERFAQIDANRDGYLVRSELRAAHGRMRAERLRAFEAKARERFTQADGNRDGRLSRDEATQGMPRVARAFAWLDENRDGFLSQQEALPQRR